MRWDRSEQQSRRRIAWGASRRARSEGTAEADEEESPATFADFVSTRNGVRRSTKTAGARPCDVCGRRSSWFGVLVALEFLGENAGSQNNGQPKHVKARRRYSELSEALRAEQHRVEEQSVRADLGPARSTEGSEPRAINPHER